MQRQPLAKVQRAKQRGHDPTPARRNRSASAHPILALQRTIGNQAVQRLLLSRQLQAKLQISEPGDKFEREADQVADRVMRMPEPQPLRQSVDEKEENLIQPKSFSASLASLSVQRKCAECPEDGKPCPKCAAEESLQRKPLTEASSPLSQPQGNQVLEEEERLNLKPANGQASTSALSAPSDIHSSLHGGEPLPAATRSFFEPRFGVDFGSVRVHANSGAAQVARSVNAKAFTLGQDVVFNTGQYVPETTEGKRLLAHELTHVVQQGGGAQAASHAGQTPSLQKSSDLKIMREGFESTVQICRHQLVSRNVHVKNGGLRVVLILKEQDKSVPNCGDFDFSVTLTKSVDWWPDDEIGTCEARTGGTRSFSFANLSAGTYYLTIRRNSDHPYCCLEGDILVYDEAVSSDSSGCTRDTDPTAMDIVHGALDIAGFIPALGAIPDGINALIYVAEGDWTNAGISAVAMVPLFGDGAKLVTKAGKEMIEVSGKTAVKMGKEEIAAGLKAARKAEQEAAQKAAAKRLEKELAEKELKKKIAECEAIHAAYKALGNCPSCKATDTRTERAAKIACLTALLAGRRKYLKERCDYVLAGSLARGSTDAERGHEIQAEQIAKMLAKCSTLPIK